MNYLDTLQYAEPHLWLKIQEGFATIGVTHVGIATIGEIVFVELPEAGTELEAGQRFGSVESVKSVLDLLSPVTGEVIEVNAKLAEEPDWVNRSPFDGGWLMWVRLTEFPTGLLDRESYMESAAQGRRERER